MYLLETHPVFDTVILDRLAERTIDVFLPLVPFYEVARHRRVQVQLVNQPAFIWDPETLIVFKLLFFRRKDIADVEQILAAQGSDLDRMWVDTQLRELFGRFDPRVSQWQELCREID